ncbi:MAG: FecR family protein [Mangrovibacterium sp.]
MLINEKIEKSILHYFQRKADSDELKALEEWTENREHRNMLSDYTRLWIWSAQLKEKKDTAGFTDLWEKIKKREKPDKLGSLRSVFWRAAVVLILLGMGWWGARTYYRGYGSFPEQVFAVSAGQNENSLLTLPDGTRVYLRQGSMLNYGSAFSSRHREVSLKGEAYFDVARDESHPFLVRTCNASIRVLGTRFNVLAEPGLCQATLEEGKVEFDVGGGKKYMLRPGQQVQLDLYTRQVAVRDVDTELYTAWKDGKVIFRDETLGEITKKLERIYHVRFIYEDDELARKYRFSGTFHRETSIGDVLTMLKLSIPMKVTREERFPEPDTIYLK